MKRYRRALRVCPEFRYATSLAVLAGCMLVLSSCATSIPVAQTPSGSAVTASESTKPLYMSMTYVAGRSEFFKPLHSPIPPIILKPNGIATPQPTGIVFEYADTPIPIAHRISTIKIITELITEDSETDPGPITEVASEQNGMRPLGIADSIPKGPHSPAFDTTSKAVAEAPNPPNNASSSIQMDGISSLPASSPVRNTASKSDVAPSPKEFLPNTSDLRRYAPMARVSVMAGQSISIPLDGRGWVFVGERSSKSGITYEGRSYTNDNTVFSFSTEEDGTYELGFQKFSSATGESEFASIDIIVGNGDTVQTAVGRVRSHNELMTLGDSSYENGEYQTALLYYLEAYREGNPAVNERIASIYEKLGDLKNATDFFSRNLSSESDDYTTRALNEVLRLGVEREHPETIQTVVSYGLELVSPSQGLLLRQAGEIMESSGSSVPAILLYEAAQLRGVSTGSDVLYYRLAALYESTEPLRDEKKAAMYYKIVIDRYPASRYYEDAKSRLAYLQRHFLEIR